MAGISGNKEGAYLYWTVHGVSVLLGPSSYRCTCNLNELREGEFDVYDWLAERQKLLHPLAR